MTRRPPQKLHYSLFQGFHKVRADIIFLQENERPLDCCAPPVAFFVDFQHVLHTIRQSTLKQSTIRPIRTYAMDIEMLNSHFRHLMNLRISTKDLPQIHASRTKALTQEIGESATAQ